MGEQKGGAFTYFYPVQAAAGSNRNREPCAALHRAPHGLECSNGAIASSGKLKSFGIAQFKDPKFWRPTAFEDPNLLGPAAAHTF